MLTAALCRSRRFSTVGSSGRRAAHLAPRALIEVAVVAEAVSFVPWRKRFPCTLS